MFRFTIRELLMLTVIVAVTGGWWVERSRAVFLQQYKTEALQWQQRARAAEAMLKHDGWIVRCVDGDILIRKPGVRAFWQE